MNLEDLLTTIEHAREMVRYYESQTAFWQNEIREIQAAIRPPPREPSAVIDVIEGLKQQVLLSRDQSRPPSRTVPEFPSEPSESSMDGRSESRTDWDDIRRMRQRKYEEQYRKDEQ
jgi:hypothetical protein